MSGSGKTRVTVAFLCYRNDSELLLESQRAAIRAFAESDTLEASFVMVDDAWCPVKSGAREKFLAAHPRAGRIATGYKRGFMILGGENLKGQCEAFAEAAELTDADILVKMDADTCMFKADWLEEFAKDEKALCAGAFDLGNNNHTSVFGLCYALKRKVLRPLAEDARRFPAHHKAWEDHEVSSRVFRLADGDMDSLMRWRANVKGDGFWVIPLDEANDTCAKARAVNCGWDYSSQPASKKAEYRTKVCAWMKRWNDLAEGGGAAT